MPTRKRKPTKRAKREDIIDAEIVEDAAADPRPTAPPIVVEVARPRLDKTPPQIIQSAEAFGMQAVVADVKEAVVAGETIGRLLRRLFR